MRIFVTGASGFIGAHFVEKALAEGHDVIGLYHSHAYDKQLRVRELQALGARMQHGNILDPSTYRDALRGCDCVCHFAAAFRESGVEDEYFQRINVGGTQAVLRTAAEEKVRRFVLCSTAGIYGQRVREVINESSPVQPWNVYEITKLAAEAEVRREAQALGVEYVILRPASVYGPRDDRLAKLFRSAAKGRFPLFGRGEGRRHMIYVSDLADAFLRACVQPAAAGQELIVAGPEAVPLHVMLRTLADVIHKRACGPQLPLKPMLLLAALVEDVSKLLRIRPPIYRRRMDFYLNDAAFDCRRARSVLGWEPRVSLREGLSYTMQAFHEPMQVREQRARPALTAGLGNLK